MNLKDSWGYRNFFIKDEAGEDIIRANSIWSLINLKTGRPVRPPEEMLTAYQLETKLPMDYEPRKIVLLTVDAEKPPLWWENSI